MVNWSLQCFTRRPSGWPWRWRVSGTSTVSPGAGQGAVHPQERRPSHRRHLRHGCLVTGLPPASLIEESYESLLTLNSVSLGLSLFFLRLLQMRRSYQIQTSLCRNSISLEQSPNTSQGVLGRKFVFKKRSDLFCSAKR